MSVTTAPPVRSFRIDMLWNDSRYRSTFLQIIALFVFFSMLFLLVDNVRDNLAALGKSFGFDFMAQPSSYDINQHLLDYTSRDSHSRAAIVGILNTLLVAVVGCFLATIFGVLAGVARLSKNWIIRKLMTVYIEVVRNVPVLIQILLFSALITETMPQPREFRGENANASMLFDAVAVTGRGIYFPRPVWLDGSWIVVAALIAGIIAVDRLRPLGGAAPARHRRDPAGAADQGRADPGAADHRLLRRRHADRGGIPRAARLQL